MFGIGFGEFLLIAIIALIFISPDKLPEIATAFAKTLREIKKASNDLKRTISDVELIDREGARRKEDLTPAGGPEKTTPAEAGPRGEKADSAESKDKGGKSAT